MLNEYYAIQKLSGLGYKMFCVIRLMTKEGKADDEGWVKLSHNAMAHKLGVSSTHISRIVADVEKFPELMEVSRGQKGSINRYRVTKDLL